jgi:hypothetical protein
MIETGGSMIIQNSTVLLEVISKIESMMTDQLNQQPNLSDEEIINFLKLKLQSENKL